MELIKVEADRVEAAARLYQSAEEWTAYTNYGISLADAANAILAPNAVWRFITREWTTEEIETGSPMTTRKVIGLAGFEKINPLDRIGEPFVALYETEQNKGQGLAAMQLIFNWGINDLNLRRMQATFIEGSKSMKFYTELPNIQHEGTLRKIRFKDGKYVDGYIYAWVSDKE